MNGRGRMKESGRMKGASAGMSIRSRLPVMVMMAAVCAACGRGGGTGGADGAMSMEVGAEQTEQTSPVSGEGEVELTLWTYPVGGWGDRTTVSALLRDFRRAYPDIHITVECVDYDTGDARIEEAIQAGEAPDLVFEAPDRIVAGWGERGLMADLSDLWDTGGEGIYEQVRTACCSRDGSYPIFPVCMSAQCMAVNYDLFKEAGALGYIDEETRTWTTEDFIQAVKALKEHGQERVAVVYCGGQGGDQGTRGLVTGLYGGSFTDKDHTAYTVDSQENIRALKLLYDLDGIVFDPAMVGSDEIAQFCRGELAMAFCWNGAFEVTQTIQNPELDFSILPMAFPTPTGQPRLQSGIWGFGVFDNGDGAKLLAAKTFIRYMTEDQGQYTRAVQASHFWPVRDMPDIYANDALMQEYSIFIPYVGDYYQITPRWPQARTAWWEMLQEIGEGADIAAAVRGFSAAVGEWEESP